MQITFYPFLPSKTQFPSNGSAIHSYTFLRPNVNNINYAKRPLLTLSLLFLTTEHSTTRGKRVTSAFEWKVAESVFWSDSRRLVDS